MKRNAFTLAEVLITLTVIGIVAALTIPNFILSYQERAWSTASAVFERKLEEALKVMNVQGTLAGYQTTGDFLNELKNHFKITKMCDSDSLDECFSDNVVWNVIDVGTKSLSSNQVDISSIKTASDLGKDDWTTEVWGVQFANGTSGLIAYNNKDCKQDQYSNQVTGLSCIALIYDTSGFKSPNTYGKDLRGLNAALKGQCAFKVDGACFGTPFYAGALSIAECEAVKDDLGIDSCPVENDNWAAAVKACGGTANLLTKEQIAKIADYVYNTSGLPIPGDVADLQREDKKLSELGFSFEILVDDAVSLWGSDTGIVSSSGDIEGAIHAAFGPTSSHGCYTNRAGVTEQTVCLMK